ncbi:uncharacterized protein LOC128234627 isoform X2 [Mya arenaria]|uniref:uncharacterized protein LOC128234627 isoform X2 n=1 Tax=Mya arenaria TaxID=6604 RepID=UPI0022E43832|nr:uncharacterized protein LOC128234627 isoform X2 [Mya arenaria]
MDPRQIFDLSKLDDLTERSICDTLKSRYRHDVIYTNVQDILIAINPEKPLKIYDEQTHRRYHPDKVALEHEPHVFHVAALSYVRMLDTCENQVIIVSGESGAGKTESTKYMLKHIVHMCQSNNMALHEKLIEINPLLEAFGNAQTSLNENSSRFAKYLDVSFTDKGQLAGAAVRDYMLEKSRVVHQSLGEANFHIFYALFAGCPTDELGDVFLNKSATEYRILKSNPHRLHRRNYEKHARIFKQTMTVLEKIGAERDTVMMMLGAVIHVAEIEFEEGHAGETQIKDGHAFEYASTLLSLEVEDFGEALISSKLVVNAEQKIRYKTVRQAEDGRDALAKVLYERLFGWLVRQINSTLHPGDDYSNAATSIGILDIAGFEKMKQNSFEQLCINLVNEKLQNFMNDSIFTMEMEIYHHEGIKLKGIAFQNNDDLITMFETKDTGLLAKLDEQSLLTHGSDGGFVIAIKSAFEGNTKFPRNPKDAMFSIRHFAAVVEYDSVGFVEKNRDRLNPEVLEALRRSDNPFISDLFTVKRGPTGTISELYAPFRPSVRTEQRNKLGQTKLGMSVGGRNLAVELGRTMKQKYGDILPPGVHSRGQPGAKKGQTVVAYFRQSLLQLVGKLRNVERPYFVKCIKANPAHAADRFEDQIVSDQLKYNGLAEIAKIRKMGFAVRMMYKDFVKKFAEIVEGYELPSDTIECVQFILRRINTHESERRFGKTKIFLTQELDNRLNRKLHEVQEEKRRKREEERRRQEAEQKRIEDEKRRKENERHMQEDRARKLGRDEQEDPTFAFHSGRNDVMEEHSIYDRVGDEDSDRSSPIPGNQEDTFVKSQANKKQENSKTSSSSKSPKYFWDIPQMITRELSSRDVDEERSLQVLKGITYVLLFLGIFWCAIVQKISLVTLVAHQYPRQDNATESEVQSRKLEATGRHLLLTLAIFLPYGFTFLSCTFKWLFGRLPMPSCGTLLFCLLMEFVHSVGLCLLAFVILPDMDPMRGIMLLNGIAFLPSILFPICGSAVKHHGQKKRNALTTLIVFCLNILVVLVQVGFIAVVLMYDNFIETSHIDVEYYTSGLFIAAMVFVSFSWWENFTDDRFCGTTSYGGCTKSWLLKMKFELQESRPIVFLFTSFLKIAVTIVASWLTKMYKPLSEDEFSHVHSIADVPIKDALDYIESQPLKENVAMLALVLVTFFGNYFATTCCKLKLQTVSFNIPLLLSTPTAVVLVALDCDYEILNIFTNEGQNDCSNDDFIRKALVYICGGIVWASLYWLCRHIFYPDIERLAKQERLFMNPFYCSVLFEQNLILNRRRHNRRVIREVKEDSKVYYSLSHYNYKINIEGEEVEDLNKVNDTSKSKENEESEEAEDQTNPKFQEVPMIYACATMWHENKQEMLQLLKSIFRMDKDQNLRRHSETISGKRDKDFYDFEAHIFFDDAMNGTLPNDFVRLLLSVIDEALSSVHHRRMKMKNTFIVPTPYGGQIVYPMPGDNFLFVHLKDKSKIRHKKRWSQVMYMYYLLGFRIVRLSAETIKKALNDEDKINNLISWGEGVEASAGNIGYSHVFRAFDDQTLRKLNNTYLLALDGDVDFTPGAVKLLVDRMKKSEKVGAACGRIHPIGTGPVVLFQKFEYAIAHWLQKATEHVLGCVLCSPGCFSMFRGSALMDDNVMKKYTILPTEASHHLMYDQGEDRWLCTLLLQQGYRVDYAAGSDAFTYAPEGFAEFFNQRRRWMPSTVFNIIDLLADYQNTVYINTNISMLYIIYQGALLLSTSIGPATVLMMIASANLIVFGTSLIWAYIIALLPAVFFCIICFFTKPKVQIQVAELLTGLYAFVMVVVIVGTIVIAVKDSPFHPSVLFMSCLVLAFAFAAFLHPKEWTCVVYGILYFVLIPTGFLLLVIYSIANLHVVSWGTREVPKEKTEKELEEEKKAQEEKQRKKKESSFFGKFLPSFPTKEFKDMMNVFVEKSKTEKLPEGSETVELLRGINENMSDLKNYMKKSINPSEEARHNPTVRINVQEPVIEKQEDFNSKHTRTTHKGILKHVKEEHKAPERDDLDNPAWAEIPELTHGRKIKMVEEELNFWQNFISKYLHPLEFSSQKKKNDENALLELRTNISTGMIVTNLLWIALNFMFQYTSPTKIKLFGTTSETDVENLEEGNMEIDTDSGPIKGLEVDILGLLFIIFYVLILLVQFIGMLLHRYGTILHLLSVTKMPSIRSKKTSLLDKQTNISTREAKLLCEKLLNVSDDDESESEEENEQDKIQQLEALQRTGVRRPITFNANKLDSTTRMRESLRMRNFNSNLASSINVLHQDLQANRDRMSSPQSNIRQRSEYERRRQRLTDDRVRPLERRVKLRPGHEMIENDVRRKYRYDRRNGRNRDMDLIPEESRGPSDPVYNEIKAQGTMGRRLGRRLRMFEHASRGHQRNGSAFRGHQSNESPNTADSRF